MTILAKLPNPNLFSSLPPTPPPPQTPPKPLPSKTPIPIPKYPPPKKRPQTTSPPNPAFRIPHANTKYYKPVKPGQVLSSSSSDDDDRAVVIGESGVSYLVPGAPFEFQFSYSETPKEKPLALREPAFLPFAPPSMPRPWTGKAPLKGKQKKVPLFDSFNPPPPGKKGVKYVERPGPYLFGKYPEEAKSREEILGEPLKKWEIQMLVQPLISDNRQINLGRDGLTHNMLELIHCHWKRRRVCKVRCKGVPTVDMDNISHHLEEKTGGKIIHRVGGVVYLFRGRNYNYRTRPQYPVMLWKPAAPVYRKLIQEAPEGLNKAEADEMRKKGKHLMPICKLAKNGIYLNLVKDVRNAFEESPLVKIDCRGMHATDYKKLGAKLRDLVPCVLLSFDDEQMLMWRGANWKSMYPEPRPTRLPVTTAETPDIHQNSGSKLPDSSKVMSLWKHALESNKALLLDAINLGPDDLLIKVEEFEGISKAEEHSYQAYIVTNENAADNIAEAYGYTSNSEEYDEDDTDDDYEDEIYDSDPLEELDSSAPLGSLPVDRLAKNLYPEK